MARLDWLTAMPLNPIPDRGFPPPQLQQGFIPQAGMA
jgi:hypothetical protein